MLSLFDLQIRKHPLTPCLVDNNFKQKLGKTRKLGELRLALERRPDRNWIVFLGICIGKLCYAESNQTAHH